MMEVLVCIGNESPEILDAIGAVVCDLEEDGRKGIVDADMFVGSGLSNNGEED